MRVTLTAFSNGDILPCGDHPYAEVEDYTVQLITNGTTTPTTYCAATGTGNNEFIAQVANITTTNSSNKYTDLTSQVNFTLTAGNQMNIDLLAGFTGTTKLESWGIWIDLNQNKVFEAGEKLLSAMTYGTSVSNWSLFIPVTAKNGITRMRVVMGPSSDIYAPLFNPCGTIGEGDVKDYQVTITGGTFSPDQEGNNPSVAKTSGIESINNLNDGSVNLNVFPVPASKFIELGNNIESGVAYQILNISGQVLVNDKISESNKINIENLDAGIYFIQVKNGEKVQVAKFIKE